MSLPLPTHAAFWLQALLLAAACAVALWLRPWRTWSTEDGDGLPWPWLACMVVMPLLWSADRLSGAPLVQPLSAACLLLLMTGWPVAVLALLPVGLATAWLGGFGAAEALARVLWLGLVPLCLALVLGASIRRWLPHHPMVYVLGRGFFTPALALTLSSALFTWTQAAPLHVSREDLMLGRWLAAWGDAWLCGFLVAIFVAFKPQWLATWADRVWLPPREPEPPQAPR